MSPVNYEPINSKNFVNIDENDYRLLQEEKTEFLKTKPEREKKIKELENNIVEQSKIVENFSLKLNEANKNLEQYRKNTWAFKLTVISEQSNWLGKITKLFISLFPQLINDESFEKNNLRNNIRLIDVDLNFQKTKLDELSKDKALIESELKAWETELVAILGPLQE